jgi:hypothetical protein
VSSLYTDDVQKFITTRDWPLKLQWEVVEYEDSLGFRLFRDNFNSFDGEDRLHIAMMVKEVMEKIRKMGIPIYMEKMESVYNRTFKDD